MKIEICESLIFSWLRHVQGCIVAQTNWKPSPSWPISNEHGLRQDFERIRSFAGESIGVQIFKKCDFAQFVRQTEIDVLGFRLAHDPAATQVFAVESAFHEGGLSYGSADETVGRVLKKLMRAALAIEAYLIVSEATIVFATPKMALPIREPIERHLADLETVLANREYRAGPRLRFRIIANGDFAGEILQPVLDAADAVADTSELLLRAQQLIGLCDPRPRNSCSRARIDRPARVTSEEGNRIGEHVRTTMAALAASGRLTGRVVGDLLDPRYCKATFNLGLPFLKPVDREVPLSRQGNDHHGRGRYWKKPLKIGDHEFLMCNHWFVEQRIPFDQWVRDLG